ncbi:MAG: shikimate kinase [Clostridiales bacterium]|nr:shikimate kinase [Clostridiales bacterium]
MPSKLKDNIVLIGMPGCGKTTIGKILASNLGYSFWDMDQYIEKISGRSIPDIFSEGEEVFRELETKACMELSLKKRIVISTGGGVVKKAKNIDILKENGLILFINRPIIEIINDVDISGRPLLKDGPEKLYELYNERIHKYEEAAEIEILNDGFVKAAVDKILKELKNKIK